MRPITFSFPTITQNEVCATQTTTASSQAAIVNGSLSNIGLKNSQQGYTPIALAVGVQRPVAVFSTGNISTSTFTISGFDCRATGLLSTTIAGPTGTAIPVQTVTEFNQVTAVSVGTLASSTFTAGFGPSGTTNWVNLNKFQDPFNVTISVTVSTGVPITIQDTPLDLNQTTPAAAFIFNHSTLATVTVSAQSNYTLPVNYARAICTATLNTASAALATSTPSVTFIQAGSGG